MDTYVLTKEQIDNLDGTPKTHFLNENAKRLNKSLGDLTGISGFGFHIIEVQPGHHTTEFHKHHHEEECVFVLEGEAEARIGEKVFSVKAGDFIGYPAGAEAHDMRNIGESVLRCIVVGQRLDHDVCEYPEQNKRLYRNKDMPWALVDKTNLIDPYEGK